MNRGYCEITSGEITKRPSGEQSILEILKEKGAPIEGVFYLSLDDNYCWTTAKCPIRGVLMVEWELIENTDDECVGQKMIKKYTKKPIAIEAVQVTKDNLEQVADWCHGGVKGTKLLPEKRVIKFWNKLHDSELTARVGDYIIKGTIQGDFYPCKEEVFKETYNLDGEQEIDVDLKFEVNEQAISEVIFNDYLEIKEKLNICIETLKFYENWDNYHYPKDETTSLTVIDLDIGSRARNVLVNVLYPIKIKE